MTGAFVRSQGTGTLTCMSGALARKLAQEKDFDTFLRVAQARSALDARLILLVMGG